MTFDPRALAAEVKVNLSKLDTCQRHEFEGDPGSVMATLKDGSPWFRRYRCTRCGGSVDSHAYHWYQLGLRHAKDNP